jgi:hypothetical protein
MMAKNNRESSSEFIGDTWGVFWRQKDNLSWPNPLWMSRVAAAGIAT